MDDGLSINDALKKYLSQSKMKNSVKAFQIKDAWEKIMGKAISKYTDKIEIINNTLFIHTNVGPLKQELVYQRENIIKRVNEECGEGTISEVVIR